MNNTIANTNSRCLSIVLIAILLSPIWISISHEFNEHEHPVCETVQTHMHAQPIDCDLCDFSPQSFTFQINKPAVLLNPQVTTIVATLVAQESLSNYVHPKRGRAPPMLA